MSLIIIDDLLLERWNKIKKQIVYNNDRQCAIAALRCVEKF